MHKVKIVLVVALYVATLLWAWATIVSPAFAYDGLALKWPGLVPMAWLITLALLPALLMPYALSRPSAVVLWWLYLAAYIPSILVPALSLSMPFERLVPLQLTLLLCMEFLCSSCSGRLLSVGQLVLGADVFWPAFLLVWGVSVWCVIESAGVSALMGNLTSLFQGATEYTIRKDYSDLIFNEAGRGLAYVVGQLANALDPFLMAFGLVYRRRMCLVGGIIGQMVVFSLTGFKAALASCVFIAIVALFMKHWRRSFGLAFCSGLIATILVCAIVDRASGNVFCSSMVTRRTLLVPGLFTGFYFEHYSRVPHVGIGLHFVRDEAVLTPPNEIGFAYFGHANTNANANLWAEGFAELGLPGIVGYTILLALMIWIYDSISARRNMAMGVLLATLPAVTVSNTGPTTVLISHGGLAAALLLYLAPWPKPGEVTEPEEEPLQVPHSSLARWLQPSSIFRWFTLRRD